MDFNGKVVINDEMGLEIFRKICGLKSPFTLSRLHIEDQKNTLKLLKSSGLSVNQISRLTGIAKVFIKNA